MLPFRSPCQLFLSVVHAWIAIFATEPLFLTAWRPLSNIWWIPKRVKKSTATQKPLSRTAEGTARWSLATGLGLFIKDVDTVLIPASGAQIVRRKMRGLS